MKSLQAYTALIEQEISQLHLPVSPANLYEPLTYFMGLGGKRLRPILTLLGAELFGHDGKSTLKAATAIEVFHNFTLIHDDIMDEAPLRRGQQTVHEKWNQNIGILSGDVLFVKAYELICQQGNEHLAELMQLFNKTAIEVCEGQQMDMDFEQRADVSEEEYIEMIRLKTSVLLGCALEMGAILANASETDRKLIYNFGQHLGIAFQIKDDILDLYADPEKFGKQVGGDVIANKKTLLNLRGHHLADLSQKETLKQLSTAEDLEFKVSRTRELFEITGAKKECEQEMLKHYEEALRSLEQINVPNENKAMLQGLAEYLLEREV
jgi:geranylgeranyl diphosphate synthase type II